MGFYPSRRQSQLVQSGKTFGLASEIAILVLGESHIELLEYSFWMSFAFLTSE